MSSVPATTSRAYDASREDASAPPALAHPPVNAETAGIAVAAGTFRHWPPRNRRNRPKPVPPQARIDSPQGPRPDQPFRPHTTDVMPAGPTIANGLVRGALPASGHFRWPSVGARRRGPRCGAAGRQIAVSGLPSATSRENGDESHSWLPPLAAGRLSTNLVAGRYLAGPAQAGRSVYRPGRPGRPTLPCRTCRRLVRHFHLPQPGRRDDRSRPLDLPAGQQQRSRHNVNWI